MLAWEGKKDWGRPQGTPSWEHKEWSETREPFGEATGYIENVVRVRGPLSEKEKALKEARSPSQADQ